MFHLFGDYLGSTNTLIDHDTGELVEKTTYSAYGLTESDYRPDRWGEFREDYRFTGKEDDIEVGLTYFGARYYAPHLGTWCSADPVTIHELGSDMNPYSYVGGRVTTAVDPNGEELITIAVGIGIGFALAAGTNATAQYVATGRVDLGQVAIAGGIGAVSGLAGAGVSGAIGGLGGAVAGGATGGAVGSGMHSAIQGQSFGDVLKSAGIGAAIGAVTGAASFGGSYAGAYLSDGNAFAAGIGGGLTGAGAGIGISAAQGESSFESALIAVGSGVISGTINGYRSSLEQRSQQRSLAAGAAARPNGQSGSTGQGGTQFFTMQGDQVAGATACADNCTPLGQAHVAVGYNHAAGHAAHGQYHMFVLITDGDTGQQIVVRAGPEFAMEPFEVAPQLTGQVNPWAQSPDKPLATVYLQSAGSTDASFGEVAQHADAFVKAFNQVDIPYGHQNSNTFAHEFVRSLGLPMPQSDLPAFGATGVSSQARSHLPALR